MFGDAIAVALKAATEHASARPPATAFRGTLPQQQILATWIQQRRGRIRRRRALEGASDGLGLLLAGDEEDDACAGVQRGERERDARDERGHAGLLDPGDGTILDPQLWVVRE